MNQDNDRIRVDLLKFRRKAYLSYPEGSQERKAFLKTVLQQTLQIAEQEVPYNMLDFVVRGDKFLLQKALTETAIWAWGAVLFSLITCALYIKHLPVLSGVYLYLSGYFAVRGAQTFYHYWKYRRGAKDILKYSNVLMNERNKISDEIKRLEGPR